MSTVPQHPLHLVSLRLQSLVERVREGGADVAFRGPARDKVPNLRFKLKAWNSVYQRGTRRTELLLDIYLEYGLYKENLVNVVKKGMSGQAEIKAMMEGFRDNPPKEIAGSKVVLMNDYELRKATDIVSGKVTPINLPLSDVLQFFLADGTKISMRPSGTEPKIKFYFSVRSELKKVADSYK